jgi:hypothetical protein
MKQTKYECGDLKVVIDDSLKAELEGRGVMVGEIHRLIESFGNKLLMTKAAGEIDFINKTTGAAMKLDITWENEESAVVNVVEVNIDPKVRISNHNLMPGA